MNNRNNLIFAALILLATMAGVRFNAMAVQSSTIVGYVSTTYDENDNAASAVLQMADESQYNVTLNDKGMELARDYDGKMVEATGTISEKDGENWLTVESFKAATANENDDEEYLDDEEPSEDDDGDE